MDVLLGDLTLTLEMVDKSVTVIAVDSRHYLKVLLDMTYLRFFDVLQKLDSKELTPLMFLARTLRVDPLWN